MPGLDWLTARPLAHRGLHDNTAGPIENTADAFAAALAAGYGIECDIQISADGEALVHHDDALGRLTDGLGKLSEMSAAALRAVAFKAGGGTHMLTLGELCDLVAGRVALLIELKSRFDGDLRLAERASTVLAGYAGPAALMSFDPAPIEALRVTAPHLVRGMVAERSYAHAEWNALTRVQKFRLAHLLHAPRTRPQFLAYAVNDLPAAAPFLARTVLGLPVLTWAVRTETERRIAARWADQMIFEGFRP
ncbi:MAG TPA: glycerophosphodiester phosphodiesterase family protein [Pseudolabrys sp.]|nr:glycerophosphodiester phosphodiesterase family protein [Pseudolabrys sp.]